MSDSSGSDSEGLLLDPEVRNLQRALLSADQQIDHASALKIARDLCENGWCQRAHGIHADRLRAETRFILRFSFTGEAASPAEEAASIAMQFTLQGATVLHMAVEKHQVDAEILTSVKQALAVLEAMQDVPLSVLAEWLEESGYTGDVESRVCEIQHEISVAASEKRSQPSTDIIAVRSASNVLH